MHRTVTAGSKSKHRELGGSGGRAGGPDVVSVKASAEGLERRHRSGDTRTPEATEVKELCRMER